MDKVVLESKLPQEFISPFMEYKPRDRDAKSPTAALIKDKLHINVNDDDDDDDDDEVWEWGSYRDTVELGNYSEEWWNRSFFWNDLKGGGIGGTII